MPHTIAVLRCDAIPACTAWLQPQMPAARMQQNATNQRRARTYLLHGHAEHAANNHAMQQLCAERAYMRVLFLSAPIPYQLWFNRASATALKGSEELCASIGKCRFNSLRELLLLSINYQACC